MADAVLDGKANAITELVKSAREEAPVAAVAETVEEAAAE
jgi:hypothetical protein